MIIVPSLNAAGSWLPASGAPVRWISGLGLAGQTIFGTDWNDWLYAPGNAGAMVGGQGDDTYFVYDWRDKILEGSGGGTDTVVSQTSFFRLPDFVENLSVERDLAQGIGNNLPNILVGAAGSQVLDGGAGDDMLYGGEGADRFIFKVGTGRDVIGDFEPGVDRIVIGGRGGFTTFAAVQTAMFQDGSDAVIELGGGDAVILRGVTIDRITAADIALPAPASNLRLTFGDDFSSFRGNASGLAKTGQATWTTTFYHGGRTGSDTEVQWYADADSAPPNPFSLQEGNLGITARPASGLPDGLTYASGVIASTSNLIQTYGYFEMRAQLPSGAGFWPAFWLLQADHHSPAEIDVMEVLGNEPDRTYATAHWGATFDTRSSLGASAKDADLSAGFNTFGMSWRPDYITWYLNDTEIFRIQTPDELNRPMFMIANLAVGGVGSWPGPGDGISSATMLIDHIRAYQFDDLAGPWRPTEIRAVTLEGTGRPDRLMGGTGPDRIIGNKGNDLMAGGEGRDTFVFKAGDGADVVTDFQSGTDTLLLVGQSAVGITARLSGINLVISYNAGKDTITLQNVKAIHDGDIAFAAAPLTGTTGNDTFDRNSSLLAQNISGGSGDDRITGGAGADWIVGGQGNDVLAGRAGRDTFAFSLWDGDDTIADFEPGADVVLLRGTSAQTTWVNPSRNAAGQSGMEINYGNQGDSIFLPGISRLLEGDIIFG